VPEKKINHHEERKAHEGKEFLKPRMDGGSRRPGAIVVKIFRGLKVA
jgi:hypothetical protein